MFISKSILVWALLIGTVSLFGGLLGLTTYSLFADGTSVEISSITVSSGETGTVEIVVKGVTDPGGLAAYDLEMKFDPSAIQIDNVSGGDAPFASPPTSNVDFNETGRVRLASFQVQGLSPTVDVVVAHLEIRAIGTIQGTSGLSLSVNFVGGGLINADGAPIPAVLVDGLVTINSTNISGGAAPATPVPATAPTPVPSVNNSNQAILPTLPPTIAPNTGGGTAAGGAGAPPAIIPTPLPATEPQVQGVPPGATVSTPTLIAPAVTSGQDPAVSPNAIATATPESLVAQRLEIAPTLEPTPAPQRLAVVRANEPSSGIAWWGWLLLGLVAFGAAIGGGILLARVRMHGA